MYIFILIFGSTLVVIKVSNSSLLQTSYSSLPVGGCLGMINIAIVDVGTAIVNGAVSFWNRLFS